MTSTTPWVKETKATCSHEECLEHADIASACEVARSTDNVILGRAWVGRPGAWLVRDVVTSNEACRRLGLTNVKNLPHVGIEIIFEGSRGMGTTICDGGIVRYTFQDCFRTSTGRYEAASRSFGIVEYADGSFGWVVFA